MYFRAIAAEMASDGSRELYDARGVDEQAIRRAALITMRRAILDGLCLATATTSTALFSHREHRIRSATDASSRYA